ncbi:tRNA 2-selenouridine(34) synthase MnmH [Pseudogemmobacter faecipullorum]|uniref:tRNA 2-selenouridine(34) synthase MnmH n=1 Tax=Pseudogemmobacter faecipullorum TaxID=2755041 RepID=A0ABS8CLA9_9RHOB|nr:tRNA 2-selenouridine(34) synthase MnmH [Pseudogemmobacter faecipullorum]MCB5410169.1 tRNA 2-selenouridine(34) synthase MnmH [Pseudogemmobacter faecipullorum]
MQFTLSSVSDPLTHGFDEIIDVRSPAEFAEDHLPGAISLPVLSDAERAEVGTIYKQVSPFTARKLGAALVAQNAARHLLGPLADRPGGWKPLVYCWRGGQRSGSFATILSQIGWRVSLLGGGYKAWRGQVVQALYERDFLAPVVLLDGNTGTAKTDLLKLLPGHGLQVLDLEGLAGHRGSLFGAMGEQPGQRCFEGRLAVAMAALDPARPVVIEAESAQIGERRLPPGLWRAMCAAPRIELQVSEAERARYLARAYADVVADPARLLQILEALRPWQPARRIADWQAAMAAGDFEALAAGLIRHHYDPRYTRHRARVETPRHLLEAGSLASADLPGLAAKIAALTLRLSPAG